MSRLRKGMKVANFEGLFVGFEDFFAEIWPQTKTTRYTAASPF